LTPVPARTEKPVPAPDDLSRYLRELHDDYVDKINRLVAENREDLIQGLVDAYTEEALAAMTTASSF
jgi:hypothetical protein